MFFYSEDGKDVFKNITDAHLHPYSCYFYFHDKEFNKLDWTIEPKQSLKDLYLERALQIRKEYEYIILCYSGGVDSSNILETFYYNNIHIDEILTVGAFSQDSFSGSDENHNGEIYHQVIPTLQKLNLPNTKITQIDYTKFFNNIENFSLIKKYGSDWIQQLGSKYYSPHHLFWRDLKNFIGQSNDKNTGVIFGIDKPYFQLGNNRPYTLFHESVFSQYGNFQNDQNFHRVNFYIDPVCINITIKQLHLILNFYIKNCLIEKTISDHVFEKNKDKIISKIIYDLKNPILFAAPKSPSKILSLRDRYLLNNKTSDIYKIYLDSLKKQPQMGDFETRKYYLTKEPLNYET